MKHFALILILTLTACSGPKIEPGLKAIVGGRLEIVPGTAIDDSVIVIAGGKIQVLGPRVLTPIPDNAETINAKGKRILPSSPEAKLLIGEPADLMFLDADTGKQERVMKNGDWVQ